MDLQPSISEDSHHLPINAYNVIDNIKVRRTVINLGSSSSSELEVVQFF